MGLRTVSEDADWKECKTKLGGGSFVGAEDWKPDIDSRQKGDRMLPGTSTHAGMNDSPNAISSHESFDFERKGDKSIKMG